MMGMEMMAKALGIDPAQIMKQVEDVVKAVEMAQQSLEKINQRLERIELALNVPDGTIEEAKMIAKEYKNGFTEN